MTSISENTLEEVLKYVKKPARYLGLELNSIKKEFTCDKLKVLLCYPDLYEIGMSNFSIKILYEIINSRADMLAERVFMPDFDMQKIMKERKIPLFSLETFHPAKMFDIIGFTIHTELNFTALLQILSLAEVNIYSNQRKDDEPIIMAGGSAIVNPHPVRDFIDIFFIGEADEILIEILSDIKNLKKQQIPRRKILKFLNDKYSFLYIPLINPDKKVKKISVEDLNKVYHPVKQIVPYLNTVQDRGVVEISRGCINGCRFCQAGYFYRPLRERNVSKILEIVDKVIENTGYDELTLLSLSISDYSKLSMLLDLLNKKYKDKYVSFSLPSLRIDSFTLDKLERLNVVRKTGLTFALETASPEIQKAINKNIDIEKFINTIKEVARRKWRTIKIYLIIGITETEEEVESLKNLIDKVIEELTKEKLHLKMNLHLTPLVRKPFTPLQYEKEMDYEKIKERLWRIRKMLSSKKYRRWINIKWQSPGEQLIISILGRGDEKPGKIIYKMWEKGKFMNTWSEEFNLKEWLELFNKYGIDYKKYIYADQTKFVWDNIDLGIKKEFLFREYKKFKKHITTPVCLNICTGCGVCNKTLKNKLAKDEKIEVIIEKKEIENHRYVLVFQRERLFKFISARDINKVFQRLLRKCKVNLAYSRGYNPRPKVRMVYPLPLFVEGENEIIEFFTEKKIQIDELLFQLNKILPVEYIRVKKIVEIPLELKPVETYVKNSLYKIHWKWGTEDVIMKGGSSIIKYVENRENAPLTSLWSKLKRIVRKGFEFSKDINLNL